MNECLHGVSNDTPQPVRAASQAAVLNGISAGQRRVWDSNPRGSSRPLAVFKTAAIGH
jgi:hypothetical protein